MSLSDSETDSDEEYILGLPSTPQPRAVNFDGNGNLEALPLELHRLIMSNLSKVDIHALLLTSHALTAIAVHELYRTITLMYGSEVEAAQTTNLLKALHKYKVLVRRVFIVNLNTGPGRPKKSLLLCRIEELVQKLCETGQLEAIVYPDNSDQIQGSAHKYFKTRTATSTEAIAKAKGLRYLALGMLNESDMGFLKYGLATKELLGFSATFNNVPDTIRSYIPVYGSLSGGAQEYVRQALDNGAVLKRLLGTVQGTITGLALDSNAQSELSVNWWSPPANSTLGSQVLRSFFENLSFARVTRLALDHWEVGTSARHHLISAINFPRLRELRLVRCIGIQDLFYELRKRKIKLSSLRKLTVEAQQESLRDLLVNIVPPNQLEDVTLLIDNLAPALLNLTPALLNGIGTASTPPSSELVEALLISLGSSLLSLEIGDRASILYDGQSGGIIFGEATLERMMRAYTNLTDLSITVDFADWVKVLQHLSLPRHLHTIHLRQQRPRDLEVVRTHPALFAIAYPASGHSVSARQLSVPHQYDVHARARLLDLVEAILLPCCTRTPMHHVFDFWKDTALRRVILSFAIVLQGSIAPNDYRWRTLGYNLSAGRVERSWNTSRYSSGRESEKLAGVEAIKVTVGGWGLGLVGIRGDIEDGRRRKGTYVSRKWAEECVFGGMGEILHD